VSLLSGRGGQSSGVSVNQECIEAFQSLKLGKSEPLAALDASQTNRLPCAELKYIVCKLK
jgi:hypothetical protein